MGSSRIEEPLEKGWLLKVFKDCELRSEAYNFARTATQEQIRKALAAAKKAGWVEEELPEHMRSNDPL